MKTLIFDFDGTLADSFEMAVSIAYELTGLPRLKKEEVDKLRRLPLLKALRAMHIPLHKVPRLVVIGRQKMQERIHELQPFLRIPEVLEELQAGGYRLLVISSNSEHNVRTFLRAHKLEDYFEGVYGGASVLNKAASLRKVLKRNHLEPKECFYIGDEVRDIAAARKAGMQPVAVSWGFQASETLAKYQPHALLHEPADLLQLFETKSGTDPGTPKPSQPAAGPLPAV